MSENSTDLKFFTNNENDLPNALFYMDKDGVIWVKSGSDKRRATSREEIQRMYQNSNLIHADEIPASGLTINDIDKEYFASFFQEQFEESLDEQTISLQQIFENLNLARNLPNNLTVENVKAGNSNIRNPILASYATKVLPYRGLGNGIRRALKVYPDIEFINDFDGNLFTAVIRRKGTQ